MKNHRDEFELVDQMHRINHHLRRRWGAQLAPHGLSPHYYRALAAIARTHLHNRDDDGVPGMRLRDIAARLRIAPRSATEVIDGLEVEGWVQRTSDPNDRRATLVIITEAGLDLFEQLRTERRRASDEYFAVLSSKEREELSVLLNKLLQAHPRPGRDR